jgi:hypothetical protein
MGMAELKLFKKHAAFAYFKVNIFWKGDAYTCEFHDVKANQLYCSNAKSSFVEDAQQLAEDEILFYMKIRYPSEQMPTELEWADAGK